jgi:hypothetical protein
MRAASAGALRGGVSVRIRENRMGVAGTKAQIFWDIEFPRRSPPGSSNFLGETGYWKKQATGRNRLLGETGYWEKQATGRNRLLGETGYWENQAPRRTRLLGEPGS